MPQTSSSVIKYKYNENTNYQYDHGRPVQWTMAFIIPMCRLLYEWILPKVFYKAAGHDNMGASFAMETSIGVFYALYVTVRLASAEESTANWILGVEFCINFFITIQIIWQSNKVQGKISPEKITDLRKKKEQLIHGKKTEIFLSRASGRETNFSVLTTILPIN